jgi:hypothetical protein
MLRVTLMKDSIICILMGNKTQEVSGKFAYCAGVLANDSSTPHCDVQKQRARPVRFYNINIIML